MSWQLTPIEECCEPLTEVRGERLHVLAAYHRAGYPSAVPAVWLRAGVLERLQSAAQLLPAGTGLLIWDGWRPLALQCELYGEFRRRIALRTGLEGAELEAEVRRLVSVPSDDPSSPPPHLTGAAVDLTLCDAAGRQLAMGGHFDAIGPSSRTDFWERSELSEHELRYRDRRRMLCEILEAADFTNYPEEWWHFDCGNQADAYRRGGRARYGAISL